MQRKQITDLSLEIDITKYFQDMPKHFLTWTFHHRIKVAVHQKTVRRPDPRPNLHNQIHRVPINIRHSIQKLQIERSVHLLDIDLDHVHIFCFPHDRFYFPFQQLHGQNVVGVTPGDPRSQTRQIFQDIVRPLGYESVGVFVFFCNFYSRGKLPLDDYYGYEDDDDEAEHGEELRCAYRLVVFDFVVLGFREAAREDFRVPNAPPERLRALLTVK